MTQLAAKGRGQSQTLDIFDPFHSKYLVGTWTPCLFLELTYKLRIKNNVLPKQLKKHSLCYLCSAGK